MKSRKIRVVLAWMKMIFTSAGLLVTFAGMVAVAQDKGKGKGKGKAAFPNP